MGDFVVNVLRWTISLPFILAGLFAFIVLLNLAISIVGVTINQSVLGDLFAMIQMWLPFDLNAVLWWFTTASSAYFIYRLAIAGISWVHKFVGN